MSTRLLAVVLWILPLAVASGVLIEQISPTDKWPEARRKINGNFQSVKTDLETGASPTGSVDWAELDARYAQIPLTDADIPDNITAASYVRKVGDIMTGLLYNNAGFVSSGTRYGQTIMDGTTPVISPQSLELLNGVWSMGGTAAAGDDLLNLATAEATFMTWAGGEMTGLLTNDLGFVSGNARFSELIYWSGTPVIDLETRALDGGPWLMPGTATLTNHLLNLGTAQGLFLLLDGGGDVVGDVSIEGNLVVAAGNIAVQGSVTAGSGFFGDGAGLTNVTVGSVTQVVDAVGNVVLGIDGILDSGSQVIILGDTGHAEDSGYIEINHDTDIMTLGDTRVDLTSLLLSGDDLLLIATTGDGRILSLDAEGDLGLAGDLTVTGSVNTATLDNPGGLTTLLGDLTVTGDAAASNITASGQVSVSDITGPAGLVTVDGSVRIEGDMATPDLEIESDHAAGGEMVLSITNANEGELLLTLDPAGDMVVGGSVTVQDEAYGPSWDGSNVVPTQNAIYDQITALEATTVDFSELTGTATDAQIPNDITIDLATLATTATTALAGDSATGFFPSGTLEEALMPSTLATDAEVAAGYQPLHPILTDLTDAIISYNLSNTAYPWADPEVSDAITVGSSGTVDDGALSANVSLLGPSIGPDDLEETDFGSFTVNSGLATLDANSVSALALDEAGVESSLEAVLDLQDLQGAVTDAQVPDTITIDLATQATTALSGDSATLFFSTGTIEMARLPADLVTDSDLAGYQPTNAILTDISDGDILTNLVNTNAPWADNEVSDTITVGAGGSVNVAALPAVVSLLGQDIGPEDMADGNFGDFTVLDETARLNANVVEANELNELAVEAGLEAVLDLQDLQGAIVSNQMPAQIEIAGDGNVYLPAGVDLRLEFGDLVVSGDGTFQGDVSAPTFTATQPGGFSGVGSNLTDVSAVEMLDELNNVVIDSTGSLDVNNLVVRMGDITDQEAGTKIFIDVGQDEVLISGAVGIGTLSPTSEVSLVGDMDLTGGLYAGGPVSGGDGTFDGDITGSNITVTAEVTTPGLTATFGQLELDGSIVIQGDETVAVPDVQIVSRHSTGDPLVMQVTNETDGLLLMSLDPFGDMVIGGDLLVNSPVQISTATDSNMFLVYDTTIGENVFVVDADNRLIMVGDNFGIPMADGSNGQVLKTDGNGTLTWSTDSVAAGSGLAVLEEGATVHVGPAELNFVGAGFTAASNNADRVTLTLDPTLSDLADGTLSGEHLIITSNLTVGGTASATEVQTAKVSDTGGDGVITIVGSMSGLNGVVTVGDAELQNNGTRVRIDDSNSVVEVTGDLDVQSGGDITTASGNLVIAGTGAFQGRVDASEFTSNNDDVAILPNGAEIGSLVVGADGVVGALTVGGAAVINEDGNLGGDFRVESDLNTHMLFVDAGVERVGIGTNAPQAELDVVGDVLVGGLVQINAPDDLVTTYPLQVYNGSDSLILRMNAEGRIDQYKDGTDGAIHVLAIRQTDPTVDGRRMGHYAFRGRDYDDLERTFARIQGYINGNTAASLGARVVIDVYDDLDGTLGTVFPNKAFTFDEDGLDIEVADADLTGYQIDGRMAMGQDGTSATLLVFNPDEAFTSGSRFYGALSVEGGSLIVRGTSGTNILSGNLQTFDRPSANYISAEDAAGYLVFRTGGGTNRAAIDADGDMGIGLINPAAMLHIQDDGATGSTDTLRIDSGDGDSRFVVDADGTVTATAFVGDGSALTSVDAATVDTVDGATGGTISSSVKVTGTQFTTAYNSLGGVVVSSSGVTPGSGEYGAALDFTKLGSATAKKASIVIVQEGADDDFNGLAFFTSPSGTAVDPVVEQVRISNNGDVGIGTMSPWSRLQLGDTSGDSVITLAGGTTGSRYGLVFPFNEPGTKEYSQVLFDWDDRATLGLQFNTLPAYPVTWNTIDDGGAYDETAMTLDNGDLGIGVSPGVRLHVSDSTAAGTTKIFQLDSSDGANRVYMQANGNIYLAQHLISTGGDVRAGNGQFVWGVSTTEGEYFRRTGNDVTVTAGGSERFTVDGDATRVGVGITSPAATLHLQDDTLSGATSMLRIDSLDGDSQFDVSADGTVTATAFAGDGSAVTGVLPSNLDQEAATPDQVLKWNGSIWAPGEDSTAAAAIEDGGVNIHNGPTVIDFSGTSFVVTSNDVSQATVALSTFLEDLADGSASEDVALSGEIDFTGASLILDAGEIADSEIADSIARDSEVAAAYQPLDATLTDLSDGSLDNESLTIGSGYGLTLNGGNLVVVGDGSFQGGVTASLGTFSGDTTEMLTVESSEQDGNVTIVLTGDAGDDVADTVLLQNNTGDNSFNIFLGGENCIEIESSGIVDFQYGMSAEAASYVRESLTIHPTVAAYSSGRGVELDVTGDSYLDGDLDVTGVLQFDGNGTTTVESGFSLRRGTTVGVIQAGNSIYLDVDDDSNDATSAVIMRHNGGTIFSAIDPSDGSFVDTTFKIGDNSAGSVMLHVIDSTASGSTDVIRMDSSAGSSMFVVDADGTVNASAFVGDGQAITIDASGFNGNLTTADDTLQEVAQAVDDLTSTATESVTCTLLEPDIMQGILDQAVLKHFPAEKYPSGVTMVSIHVGASSAYTSETFNFEESASPTGSSPSTVEAITLTGATGEDDGTFSDGSIAADGYLLVDLDDTPEDVAAVTITLTYTVN